MVKMTDEERRERERQQKYVSGRARDLALRRLANRHEYEYEELLRQAKIEVAYERRIRDRHGRGRVA